MNPILTETKEIADKRIGLTLFIESRSRCKIDFRKGKETWETFIPKKWDGGHDC